MITDALALNPQGLDGLRSQAKMHGGRESVRAAAEQFESYFLQMMLRSMRQTLSQDGLFDSQETKAFTDMFDQQMAQTISKNKGIGLADMLEAQIKQSMEANPGIQPQPRPYDFPMVPAASASQSSLSVEKMDKPAAEASLPGANGLHAGNFVHTMWPHAVDAASALGVSPHLILAQSALETGWGKHVLKDANGDSSNNLFNIKAGKDWQGKTVTREVTEFVHGKAVKSMETFRAYDTPAEAFADYAKLMLDNPRYAGALNQDAEGFIQGLKQGGYATDPGYGEKLRRVISSAAFRAELMS